MTPSLLFLALGFSLTSTIMLKSGPTSEHTKSWAVELIDVPRLTPHCGCYAFESAMLFRVVQDERLRSTSDSVVIVFRCPEGFGSDFFQQGRQYQIELVDTAPDTGFSWMTSNSYVGLELPTFWATTAQPRFFSGAFPRRQDAESVRYPVQHLERERK